MTRERNAILVSLLVLAAAAWALLAWQATRPDAAMAGVMPELDTLVFLSAWVLMMVAMMFPTAAPMILTFDHVSVTRRQRNEGHVPTWLFVSSYLVMWIAFGVVAYSLSLIGQAAIASTPWLTEQAPRIGGAVLALAGLYQLSPLKTSCLSKCRTPMDFVFGSWRDGHVGAIFMGVEHGVYCLGCCWLLFVILFPLGVMNLVAMVLITLVIFAEKSLRFGPSVSKLTAAILVAYGLLAVLNPGLLPTAM
jgi:predicted metal-binding membrane protein